MNPIKPIALQLYTVRDAMAQDWEGTLEQIAKMGYKGVETAGFSYAPIEKVVDKLNALGLQITSAHTGLPVGDGQAQMIADVKTLGCDKLIVGGTGHDQFGTVADIQNQAALFNEANAACKANGLQFGLHNHWWEYQGVNGRYAYDILLDHLDDDVLLEIDTYWVKSAGADPVAEIQKLGKRVPLLHIKDGSTNQADDMTAVGAGVMNFHEIIPAAAHAEWLIVELDRCATDMLTAVQQSYTYLTSEGLASGLV